MVLKHKLCMNKTFMHSLCRIKNDMQSSERKTHVMTPFTITFDLDKATVQINCTKEVADTFSRQDSIRNSLNAL